MVFLFRQFGFNGGLLILGALQANACISGLLYRPLNRRSIQLKSDSLDLPSIYKEADAPTSSGQVNLAYCKDNEDIKETSLANNADTLSQIIKEKNCINQNELEIQTPVNNITFLEKDEQKNEERKINKISTGWYSVISLFKKIGEFLDISVWTDLRFSLYAVSQGLSVMSYLPVSTFIPAAAIEKGIDELGAAMILSSMALGDTIGRLCSGFFFDLPFIRKTRFLIYMHIHA